MLILALFLSLQDREGVEFFEQKIRPILAEKCYACHSEKAEKLKGSLHLDSRDGLLKGGDSGPVIVPGHPEKSLLLKAIRHLDPDLKMPPKEKLSAAIVADFEAWIRRGAPDPRTVGPKKDTRGPLWSLQPLRDPPLDSIDAFIHAALAAKGLKPSPPADKRTLIRRATFDLTGLPPTPEEVDAFLADPAPEAFAKGVDRLLASPHYGERWGRHWLDTVHYGETHGYDKDKPRRNAWPYRDYVIKAFNQDKPYSKFVEEQLAGDVLAPDDADAVVATGFIAAGPWDYVGHAELPETKTDGLIARYNDRDDMLMTAMSTFQSMTVHCARCHDHKFDPIPQEDYYALQAVFAGVDRADRTYDADPAVSARRRALEEDRKHHAEPPARPEIAALEARIAQILKKPAASPSNGYHSAIETSPDREKWVQIDFPRVVAIDAIRLIPARPTDFKDTPGFGFPVRYRVEIAEDKELTPLFEAAGGVGDAAVVVPGEGRRARSVRITATRLWERTKDYVFALAEVQVISGGENVAAGASVTSLDSIQGGRWARKFLVDGYDSRSLLKDDQERSVARLETELRELLTPQERADRDRRRAKLAAIDAEIAALPPPRRVYAAASEFAAYGTFAPPKGPRPIHVLIRGDVKRPGKPAVPGALSCVPGLRFDPGEDRRAALAKWITDPRNVLTRRSIVNRVWHYHFGRGIVETPNDFGHMGAPPSHPELLDWLACRFLEGGESLKKLHRLILLSATWQQSSASNAEFAKIDADNRFLWRMNRSRLDAESFRDALLAVSGRLDRAMGGPSVEQFHFKDDHSPVYDYGRFDPDAPRANRRSVYRFIVRSVPDPFMDTLDGADPSILTPRRNTTLTALQALTTLNNAFVLRQCVHFADRAKTVEAAYRLAFGRAPAPEEARRLGDYASHHGLANACRLLVNSNEFMFVD